MSKTMAEVLAEHSNLEWSFEYGGFICAECGWQETYALPYQQDAEAGARTAHQAATLSAAGFGLVADAKAEALREAALALMDVNEHESRMPGIRFAVGFLSGQKRAAS